MIVTSSRPLIMSTAESLVKAFKPLYLTETDVNGTFFIGYGRKVTPGTYPSGITSD